MNTMEKSNLRLLTQGEIRLAREIFKDTIAYHKVWIHKGSYLPFNLQNKYTAMSPNGEMYFKYWYRSDFSLEDAKLKHIFIHEMVHVWQFQHGMAVRTRGLFSGLISYRYTLDGRSLKQYRMEQQASIVADYFLLQTSGYNAWKRLQNDGTVKLTGEFSESTIKKDYKTALRFFPWSRP